jgi:hypothetical protein
MGLSIPLPLLLVASEGPGCQEPPPWGAMELPYGTLHHLKESHGATFLYCATIGVKLYALVCGKLICHYDEGMAKLYANHVPYVLTNLT